MTHHDGDLELFRKNIEGLSPETLNLLAENMVKTTYSADDRIMAQGESGDELYMIADGTCSISIEKDEEVYPIAMLKAGDIVGEMAIVTGEPRSAHVDAKTEVTVWKIGREQFDGLCEKHPDLREFLTKIIEKRIHSSIFKEQRDVGKYVIQNILGKGSLSTVYKGVHRHLDLPVAIKMLKHNMAMNQDFFSKFKNEARGIVQLDHDNIVKVYDIVNLYRTIFIFMEYIEGTPLTDVIKDNGGYPLAKSIDILIQICSALAQAHELGLVHQDLKPSNIFVTSEGQVKIIDFGLAHPRSSIDSKQVAMIRHLSPEQLAGRDTDVRTDIYSVGITAFELITGGTPFPEQDAETFLRTADERIVPDPRTIRPDVPEALSAVLGKATQQDPGQRQQNILELKDELTKIARGMGVEEKPRGAEVSDSMIMTLRYRQGQAEKLQKLVKDFGEELKKIGVDCNIT